MILENGAKYEGEWKKTVRSEMAEESKFG